MRGALLHVRVSGTEKAQLRRGRRRAWEDQANFVTDATNSRSEEGGLVSSLPCALGVGEATTHLEGAVERRAGPTTWEKERACAEATSQSPSPPPPGLDLSGKTGLRVPGIEWSCSSTLGAGPDVLRGG